MAIPESNKTIAARWFEQVWNHGRREAIEEMILPGCVIHDGAETTVGPQGFYSFFDRMHASFSDIHITIQSVFHEDDLVCLRWSCSLRHSGDELDLPATGKVVNTTGISIRRFAGGQIAEGWQNWDMLGLMQQITESPAALTYIAAH